MGTTVRVLEDILDKIEKKIAEEKEPIWGMDSEYSEGKKDGAIEALEDVRDIVRNAMDGRI